MQAVKKKYCTVMLVSALIVALDQLTKFLVCKLLPLHTRVEVIHDYLHIVHIRNTGVAFGLFKGFGSQFKVLSLLAVTAVTLFLAGFLISQIKKGPWLHIWGLSLIMGGAVGNLIDRYRFNEVVDFVDAHWRNIYHWPAFNVADAAITVGIVLIAASELLLHKKQRS